MLLLEFLQVVIAPWKDFALDWVARCSTDGEGEFLHNTKVHWSDLACFAVDWILFSKVFEALVRLMNALSQHFTTRLDASAVSDPLPEIRLDGVKSSR
jgi:hypothetical protein